MGIESPAPITNEKTFKYSFTNEGGVCYTFRILKNPIVKEGKEIVFKDSSYIQGVRGITSGKLDDGCIAFAVGSDSYSFWINGSS